VSYSSDAELSRVLSADRGVQPPPEEPQAPESDQEIPPEAQRDLLNRTRGKAREAFESPETQRDFLNLLAALPGPREDLHLPWDDRHRKLLLTWLKVPSVCIAALQRFLTLRQDLLEPEEFQGAGDTLRLVPREPPVPVSAAERGEYEADIPALTVRWMIADAERAWKNTTVRSLLGELSARGASTRLVLLLSFVPTALFETLKVRRGLAQDRRESNPVVKRYENPQTRISAADEEAEYLRKKWSELGHLPEDDQTLKTRIARAYRPMDREYERSIWEPLGLDKTPTSEITRHDIWWWIAHPLITYLEPFAPGRKTDPPGARSRITPEAVFTKASQLLSLRSGGLWPNKPGLLKSRYYSAL
jgi:hypothetical protein